MTDFQDDLNFLKAALPDLQSYVLSTDVFWPLRLPLTMPGTKQSIQLTIGSLQLSLTRLSVLPLSAEQQAELESLRVGIEGVREEWRANWAQKATREHTSRLHLWQQYLRELRGEPRQQSAYYANEVRQRTIMQLLASEMLDGVSAKEEEQLHMLDSILRGLTEPGVFVWEAEAAPAFSQDTFWYLYAAIRA